MVELSIITAVSFGLAFLVTPGLRDLALRLRLVDNPDGRRKLHRRATPVAGGPILLLSVGAALLLTLLRSGAPHAEAEVTGPHLIGLLLAGLVICCVGIFDDLGRLRGRHKLVGQVLAVGVLITFGVRIHWMHLFGMDFDLGMMAVPFTAFFLLGAINSLNLLDGMDGLLTSVSLIACISFGSIALLGGKDVTAGVAFALAGALLAFLWFNFPPATIFLGDSGSMLIGLTIGVLAIDSSLKRPATIALATPLALLTIPILDTLAAILRRKLTGRSIYSTDRGHLHHCLLRRFDNPRRVLLIVSICCLATGAGAVAGQMLGSEAPVLLSSFVVVVTLVATRLFGHAELLLVSQRVGGMLKSLLRPRPAGEARQSEVRLQGTADWRELWLRITASAMRLNLCHVRLDVNAPGLGEGYHARWDRAHERAEDEGTLWRALIPLAVKGCTIGELHITGRHDEERIDNKIAGLARMLGEFEFVDPPPAADAVSLPVFGSGTPVPPTLNAVGREDSRFHRANF